MRHQPVMAEEVVQTLNVRSDGAYVDATYGRGGHARLILSCLGERGRLLAIDRDPDAIAAGRRQFAAEPRLVLVHAPFSRLAEVVAAHCGLQPVLGIVMDLGVSSPQLEAADRGFSFRRDGPLDMRMDPSHGQSAAEWLQDVDEQELAGVLKELGEERFARRIARAIVARREVAPLGRTAELADLIACTVPTREPGKNPATRAFQAIRIRVNSELEELSAALPQAVECLAPGGRLVVIGFHSLEDRLVKRFIRNTARADPYPPDLPVRASELRPALTAIGRARHPSREEVAANPRARSAVLRVAERTAVPYAGV